VFSSLVDWLLGGLVFAHVCVCDICDMYRYVSV